MKNSHKNTILREGAMVVLPTIAPSLPGGFKNAKAFLNYFTGRKRKLLLHLLHGSS